MLLGHPIDLKAKAGGEKSRSERRGALEDAEGVVLQDPRDRAKARLPESQSPVVEPHTHCYSAWIAVPQERIVRFSRSAPSTWRGDGERLHSRG